VLGDGTRGALRADVIEGILQTKNYTLAKHLLDVADTRHRALSGNLANVETPGYKRVDLPEDFASELRKAVEGGSFEPGKFRAQMREDPSARAVRPDGNNVALDEELLEINRNALEYQFLTEYVSRSVRRLETAITGRT